jgi:hypothetical protein
MHPNPPLTYPDRHGRMHPSPKVAEELDKLEDKFYPRDGDGMKESQQRNWGE